MRLFIAGCRKLSFAAKHTYAEILIAIATHIHSTHTLNGIFMDAQAHIGAVIIVAAARRANPIREN